MVKSLLSQPAVPYRTARLTLVGQGRAGKTALVRGIRNGWCRFYFSNCIFCISVNCEFPTAPFKETESTCGAATCTVTSVNAGADHQWNEDTSSEAERILRKKAAINQHNCQVCKKAKPGAHFSESEKEKLRRGEPAICKSCYSVSALSLRFSLSCYVHLFSSIDLHNGDWENFAVVKTSKTLRACTAARIRLMAVDC